MTHERADWRQGDGGVGLSRDRSCFGGTWQRAVVTCAVAAAILVGGGVAAARPAAQDAAVGAAGSPASPNPAKQTMSSAVSALASKEIEIGWVGDTTPGSKYGNPPSAGRALFQYMRKYLLAPDIMVANLEGTFGNGGPSKCGPSGSPNCWAFQAPPANAASLKWAGIDVVNLANNHSNDYFAAGQRTTLSALKKNGIPYAGLHGAMAVKTVNGVKVAFLGFSPNSWTTDIGNITAAKALVRKADRVADVVVVLMHVGAEGADKTHTPTGAEYAYGAFRGRPRAFSHAVIDAGADVVLGSGPHVVRGMEQYKGRVIAYSVGNFAGWKNFNRSGTLALSGLLTVRVAGDGRVLGGKWLPLRLTGPGVPKVDSTNASLTLVRRLSAQDFKTPVRLNASGTFAIGAK